MWRQYQSTNTMPAAWKACEDAKSAEVAVKEAYHMTMLATDIVPAENADYTNAKYFGDLVIDIDHGSPDDTDMDANVTKSITSAKLLVSALGNKISSVDQLQIYVTGKKGFHIQVPWKLMFTKKSPSKDLPAIYKIVVKGLEVETGASGIDYGLYSKGKGHMIRIPNKQRKEGTYKVQISAGELDSMTVESYRMLSAAPRPALQSPELVIGIGLVGLIQAARLHKEALPTQESEVPSECLEGFGVDKHPECINRLLLGGREKPDKNFNAVAMQLAIYMQSAAVPYTEKGKILEVFATANPSSSYRTIDSRIRHVEMEAAPYVKGRQFSCQAMRGTIEMAQGCGGCLVQAKVNAANTTQSQIMEDTTGTYFVSQEGAHRRLTNFTMDLEDIYSPEEHIGRMDNMGYGGTCAILDVGIYQTTVDLNWDTFETAKDFRSVFRKYRYAKISVTDADVRLVIEYLLEKKKGENGVRVTSSVGMRSIKYTPDDNSDAIDVMIWVEKGWSLSSLGLTGGVKLTSIVKSVMKHERLPAPRTPDAELESTLSRLLQSSEPRTIGLILGWVCATQIKEHIIDRVHEFPLLNITGIAGSGKTSLAQVFTLLGGAEYLMETPPTAQSMTPAAIREMSYETTSVPRVLDECRKGSFNSSKWGVIRETLKSCYQRSTISIGTIGKDKQIHSTHNVKVINFQATSPIIFLSTVESDEAEIWERSIEIKINKATHFVGDYGANFESLKDDPKEHKRLSTWSKLLVRQALATSPEQAYTRYTTIRDEIPKAFDYRVKNSFAWVFFGLDFLAETLKAIGYSDKLLGELKAVQDYTKEWLVTNQAEIHLRKSRTEVDNFFEKLVQIISRVDSQGNSSLRSGVHYVRTGNILRLNSEGILGEYRIVCKLMGQTPEFSNAAQIKSAITDQAYFLGEAMELSVTGVPQPWLKFDIKLLEERGNGCSRFEES